MRPITTKHPPPPPSCPLCVTSMRQTTRRCGVAFFTTTRACTQTAAIMRLQTRSLLPSLPAPPPHPAGPSLRPRPPHAVSPSMPALYLALCPLSTEPPPRARKPLRSHCLGRTAPTRLRLGLTSAKALDIRPDVICTAGHLVIHVDPRPYTCRLMVAQLGTSHLPQRVERHFAQGAKLLGTLRRRWDDALVELQALLQGRCL